MTGHDGHDDRRLRSIQALLRVRELELHRAEGVFQRQQREVFELEADLLRLEERCERLSSGRDGNLIRRRRVLDALIKTKLARMAELDGAKRDSIGLLPAIDSARGRRNAAFRLWSRRRLDREAAELRRQEAAAADMDAAKLTLRKGEAGER